MVGLLCRALNLVSETPIWGRETRVALLPVRCRLIGFFLKKKIG